MKPAIFKNITLLTLLICSAIIIWPVQSWAIDRKIDSAISEKAKIAICDKFSGATDKIVSRMTEKEGNINNRQETRLTNLKTKRDERKAKLAEHRTYWDNIRAEKYTELEAKATTDEQKQAVTDFQNTVEAAVKTRRAAIDAAISQFQNDVNTLVSTRQNSVDLAVEKYKNAVQAALAKAKSDCAAGSDFTTVRTELKSSLEAARTTLQTDRSDIDKVSDGIDEAIAARKAAFEAAWTTFKTTLESAKEELKNSFSKN